MLFLFPEDIPLPIAVFFYGIPGAGKDFFEKILARQFQEWFKARVKNRVEDGSFRVVRLSELTIAETEELISLMGPVVFQLSPDHLFVKEERGLYSGFLPLLDPDKLLPHFTQEGYNGKNPTLFGKRTYQIALSIQQRFTHAHGLRLSYVYQDAPNNLDVRKEQLKAASPGTFLIHVLVDTPLWKCEARNQQRARTIEHDEFARCTQAPNIFEELKGIKGGLGGMWLRITDTTPGETLATNRVIVTRSDGFIQTYDVVRGKNGVTKLIPV